MNRRIIAFSSVFVLVLVAVFGCQKPDTTEIDKWRSEYEARLKSEDGWLTVVGLYWLKEGKNTVGAGPDFDVQLTGNFKQGKLGEVDFHDGKAELTLEPGVQAASDGRPFTTIGLVSDDPPNKPNKIQVGSQTFYLIKREDRYGIRIKDVESDARRNFTGLHWFPFDDGFRVTADFEPFETPQEIDVPNILGGSFKMSSPGLLSFRLGGKEYSLQPVEEDGELFIIFKDLTSKSEETYGGGRFLYAAMPQNGKVVLDFNKAENPPCAYTAFATCPLPPPQNRLDVEIRAGEKRFGDH